MMQRSLLALLTASFAAACSSSSSPSSTAQPDGGVAANTLSFAMHETVAASSEIFGCMYVQPSVDRTFFTKIAHTFTPGSHHLVLLPTDLTSIPAGQDQPHDCYAGGADFMSHARGFMYGSQLPADSFDLPQGIAFYSDPGAVYLLQSHYLNTSAAPLDATVTVTLTTSDGSDVTTKAGALFFYDQNIAVPMGATASAGMRCPIPKDVTLLRVIPHTHARGTTFSAFIDPASGAPASAPFYTSTDWEHPAASPSAMPLPAGSHVRFKCDYANINGTQDYYQGTSALTNEMCVFGGVYYPDMGLLVNNCSAPDQIGVGTLTCKGTADCLDPCYGMTDSTQRGNCVQACLAKSCPSAGPAIETLSACANGTQAAGCKMACSPGGTGCVACVEAACPTETTACNAQVCE